MNFPDFFTNGKIWTGSSLARSITVRFGRIEALDADPPAGARIFDLGGRLVVPGFIDNHLHFVMGSRQLTAVQLRDAGSLDEFVRRIGEHARKTAAGGWITGGGWDEQLWSPAVVPTRESIDALTREHPVFVTRLDLHMALANSVALKLAGITRDTSDPAGGTIVRDGRGEPTGLLKDAAMPLVSTLIPSPTLDERAAAIRGGLREAARLGVTSFCDMGITDEAFDELRAYQRLERENEMTARVFAYPPIHSWNRIADAGAERGFGSARVRIAGVKGFSDGSLGSSTAAFYEAYADEPGNRGLLMQPMDDGRMERWIHEADAHELQPAIHAIGDRANDEVLKLFAKLPHRAGRRLRIEHAQHLDARLVGRFVDLGVIAAAQPYHAIDDGRWAVTKVGRDRERRAFPFRTFLDAGVRLTFGSDWPVAPLNPILGIHAAVTRRTIDGKNPEGWVPEQKISVEEALRCYTTTGAWAVYAERELGTLGPGMRADFVVLSRDLFTIPAEEIEGVRVEMTVFDGRVIYEA